MASDTLQKTTIMAVQGQGIASPLASPSAVSSKVIVQGIITAIQQRPLGKQISTGLYLQDKQGDGNPLTSDAVFVVTQTSGLNIGDSVTVSGVVTEQNGLTQITADSIIDTLTKNQHNAHIRPVILKTIASDDDFAVTLERHEGMLVTVTPTSKLHVARSFSYDRLTRRNNMALSHGQISYHPNQYHWPSSQASNIQRQSNLDNLLIVDSFTQAKGGDVPWYSDFAKRPNNHIRIGDSIDGLTGVIGFSNGQYRLTVTQPAGIDTFIHQSPRTTQPQLATSDIRVATFNVLNYFNSSFGGTSNPSGQNRGAKSPAEFEMQATKIVNAIVALDADIIGLMEIENNGYGQQSALQDLVTRLNATLPPSKHYNFGRLNEHNPLGNDAITNQVIYRPSIATLLTMITIPMPQQHAPKIDKESGDNYMRDALTPTFKINDSGAQLTVSINHFKSKGSTCWEDVALQHYQDDDRQGSCEHLRVSGAFHLGQQLSKIDGHKLIIGDLNSYAKEDPLLVLTHRHNVDSKYTIEAARDTYINKTPLHGKLGATIHQSFGYINTVAQQHPRAFGYSYQNVVGTLDYILASPSLKPHIVDAIEWNINSPESPLLEYSTKYTADMKKFNDPYRSSDHDPVIIALRF